MGGRESYGDSLAESDAGRNIYRERSQAKIRREIDAEREEGGEEQRRAHGGGNQKERCKGRRRDGGRFRKAGEGAGGEGGGGVIAGDLSVGGRPLAVEKLYSFLL